MDFYPRLAKCLLLVIAISTHPWRCDAQQRSELGFPFIRNYEPKEYGFDAQVFSILQDKDGILYFGLSTELIQYDGRTWRPIGLPNAIYNLAQNSSGTIYVGCSNDFGYLQSNEIGKITYHSLKENLHDTVKIGTVWHLKATTGKVYFVTDNTVYEYDLKSQRIRLYNANLKGFFEGCFVDHDIFYVRLSKEGMMMIVDGQLVPAPHSSFFKKPNGFTAVIDVTPTEKIIATKKNRMFIYSTDLNKPPVPLSISNPEFLVDNSIYTACTGRQGQHLIGSTAKGAILIDDHGNQLNQYNEEGFLPVNGVISVNSDRQNNLWLGLDNGMTKTEHGQDISYWNKHNGLKGGVSAIHRYRGSLYVGTNQGAFQLDKLNKPVPIENLRPGSQNWAFAEIMYGSQTKLLLGNNFGVFEIEQTKAKQIFQGTSCTILSQSRVNPDRLYTTNSQNFTSLRYENNKWISEGEWKGVKGRFRNIEEEADGTLWIGTNNGGVIHVVPDFKNIQKPKTVIYYSTKDGLPSIDYSRPFSYKKEIIFGTPKGLYQYNKILKKFEPYCKISKRLCDGSTGILSFNGRLDSIILVSPPSNRKSDVGYFQKKGNSFDWIYKPFRRLPEMAGINAIWVDDDQTIWIGQDEGLYKYDRKKDDKDYDKEFSCLIRKVTVNEDSVIYWGNSSTSQKPFQLQYSQNNLSFEFAAPFFDQEENTHYSFQLGGYEKAWSGWSKHASKEFTNIKEGDYTFQVKAKNIYDKESKVATFSFTISPPWFRSMWAYISYVMLLIVFIRAVVFFRTRSLLEDKVALESKIKERTKELSLSNSALQVTEEELRQNNEELTATLENLKVAQQQLINSEKMASLGHLTAGIAHEINNPLTFIWGGIQALQDFHKETIALLKSGKPVTTEQAEEKEDDFIGLMGSVDNGVKRITKIIHSLRVFSSPVEEISSDASVDVRDCIESSLTLLNSKLFNKNIEIIRNYHNTPNAKANYAQISQVLVNVMDNAIQALDEIPDKRTLEFSTDAVNGMVVIKIKDNGPGIPAEYHDKIMNPFFTTKQVGKGTGLGLSISYGIIQKHHGEIKFTSKEGVGTEFCIWLPMVG